MPYSSKRTDNTMAKRKNDKKKNNVPRNATQMLRKGKPFLLHLWPHILECDDSGQLSTKIYDK